MSDAFDLLERTAGLEDRYREVMLLLSDPAVIADRKRFEKLSREYNDLEQVVDKIADYKSLRDNLQYNQQLISAGDDPELVAMAKSEVEMIEDLLPDMEKQIKLLLVPKDPDDEKNAIVEIRAGTGGDEAALFAGDLYKMYTKYCLERGWQISTTSMNEGALGGFKEIVFTVQGTDVYGTLKYESGVHRVQRIPATETQGRIHTSAATVAILPEADEEEVVLNDADIRVDTYCSSGAGGQSVNTTYSAVRLTHIPTGIVVQCQDERSQIKNKERAMNELRTRIYNVQHQKYLDEIASQRKTLVSTGDRSAKIRTYNFPQGRVTDHRINLTVYQLDDILAGDIQPFIDALTVAENASRITNTEL